MKPRIYWHWYPKLQRGFWRYTVPYRASFSLRQYAANMCQQMNAAIDPKTGRPGP